MERFAFSLDEDAKKWLKDRSDELDISRAELVRRLIAHARKSDSPVIHGDSPSDTPSDTVAELRAAVEDHEERLDALEAGGGDSSVSGTDTFLSTTEATDATGLPERQVEKY